MKRIAARWASPAPTGAAGVVAVGVVVAAGGGAAAGAAGGAGAGPVGEPCFFAPPEPPLGFEGAPLPPVPLLPAEPPLPPDGAGRERAAERTGGSGNAWRQRASSACAVTHTGVWVLVRE